MSRTRSRTERDQERWWWTLDRRWWFWWLVVPIGATAAIALVIVLTELLGHAG